MASKLSLLFVQNKLSLLTANLVLTSCKATQQGRGERNNKEGEREIWVVEDTF
jgi:hypothetical protein